MLDKTVVAIFKIVPQLLLPYEVIDGVDFKIDQTGHDVAIVDVCCDKSHCYLVVDWL